jgi:hypothetical protein
MIDMDDDHFDEISQGKILNDIEASFLSCANSCVAHVLNSDLNIVK